MAKNLNTQIYLRGKRMKIYSEHMQVLKTMCDAGLITRQAMKSIRGQLKSMKTCQQREIYLKKLILRAREGD